MPIKKFMVQGKFPLPVPKQLPPRYCSQEKDLSLFRLLPGSGKSEGEAASFFSATLRLSRTSLKYLMAHLDISEGMVRL
jgi:hypothetical protein